MYRVHKTTLAHYSPVFADMFALPTTADQNETFEGLPVVHLHDDCEDVERFLTALYGFGYVLATLPSHLCGRVSGFSGYR